MYGTYLRRELAGRKKQTIIVAAGLAIAIALVIVVNGLSAGVRDAQASALESVYGVGTDLTVTGARAEPDQTGSQRFEFGQEGGETADDGTTSLRQSRLAADPRRATLEAATVGQITDVEGVAAAVGALSLTSVTFSGEVAATSSDAEGGGQRPAPDAGGAGGFAGARFGLDSFSVLGVSLDHTDVGPFSAVALTEGRGLESADAGSRVAVLDETYASTSGYVVGEVIEVGDADVEVVGIVSSASSDADTAADVFVPLDVAQTLAGLDEVVSTVYVQAASADQISVVQTSIESDVPEATVSSQSDLASSVSGSLSSAGALIASLGTWLSVLVLGVAVALAVLFTIASVSRRTREFGTLKAIGWSNRRVVGQVAGESVVQGVIGGAAGLLLGLAAVAAINIASPTISAAATETARGPGGQAGGPDGTAPTGPAEFGQAVAQATDIVLTAPLTPWVVVAAVSLAVGGGLIAGAVGGWRASRLSPAEALRSVG